MSNLGRRDSGDVAGGGGGGVTPGELAAVRTIAQTAQATADGKVAKAGDTMTGALVAPKFTGPQESTNIAATARTMSGLAPWGRRVSNAPGTLAIKLLGDWQNITAGPMLALSFTLYDYNRGACLIIIGGYINLSGGFTRWTSPSAYISDQRIVSRVRLGVTADREVYILLDTPSGVWAYPTIALNSATQGWTIGYDLSQNVAYDISSTPPALTTFSNVSLNAGFIPASGYSPAARGYLNGSTGAFTLKYGDMAVTKTGTGAYQISSGSLAGFKAEIVIESATPILPATFDAATSTLRTWDISGNPADASGNIFVWI